MDTRNIKNSSLKGPQHWDKHLTIGIPVRNEANTLVGFLDSLKTSVDLLPADIIVETIICINGSTDASEEAARLWIRRCQDSRLNPVVAHSKMGKMEAQRAILNSRCFHGIAAFFDADVVLDEGCLLNLWNAMQAKSELQVAYARVRALNYRSETIIEWIQSVHYTFPHLLSPRRYYHGRAYLIRPTELFFLDSQEAERINTLAEHKRRFSWMQLNTGPLVDDIHLSRLLVHRYGLECVQEVREAIVDFTAPRTVKDFFEGQRRLLIELRRLDILFPDHAHLQGRFERRLDRRHIRTMRYGVRIHHFLYRSTEKIVRLWIRINILWSDYFHKNPSDFWISLESTKKFRGGNNDKH